MFSMTLIPDPLARDRERIFSAAVGGPAQDLSSRLRIDDDDDALFEKQWILGPQLR